MSIAFFIPHLGCRHDCSFCNQRIISGALKPVTAEEVGRTLKEAAKSLGDRAHSTEVAFFGGSFTAVEPEYRSSLLKVAFEACKEYGFTGIRISTRPDAIDEIVLRELKEHQVRVIELGAQSMDDAVLRKNGRGHTAQDTTRASGMIHSFGFSLVLQMMTGLFGDTESGAMKTAEDIAAMNPDAVRIYPALVLRGTHLEQLYQSGSYQPQSLDEAIGLSVPLLLFFKRNCIDVIRLGLHDGKGISENLIAGPYHPAFRELCEGRILAEEIKSEILRLGISAGTVNVMVPKKDISKLTGHGRIAIKQLEEKGYRLVFHQSEYRSIRLKDG